VLKETRKKLAEQRKTLEDKVHFLIREKEKNGEVRESTPRVYFFFAGAFFSSFLTGFLATKYTSGYYICWQFVFKIC
jgi:hypothetical protein